MRSEGAMNTPRTIYRDFAKDHGPCIYFDRSSKGDGRHHKCWRAEISNGGFGPRIRRRFASRAAAEAWVRGDKIYKTIYST